MFASRTIADGDRPAGRRTPRALVAALALAVAASTLAGVTAAPASAADTVTDAASCGRTNAKLVPACGAWWGMWPRTDAKGVRSNNLPANVASLEAAIGRKLDIVSRYKGWGEDVYDGWDRQFRDSGHIVLEDLTARDFRTNTYTSWASIAAGEHDDYLRAQALRAKAFGAKTFFSFNQEPEQALERGNAAGTPAEFAAAYRHVHGVFVEAGATNVVWVWWVMGWSGHNAIYDDLWPGAAYVDWIAYDPYDFNSCHGRSAKTPEQAIVPWYTWIGRQSWAAGKPLMLAEYGTNGADKGAWLAGVPKVLWTHNRIKAAVQFNSKPGSCDHRVTASPANLAGFRTASRMAYVNPRASVKVAGRVVARP